MPAKKSISPKPAVKKSSAKQPAATKPSLGQAATKFVAKEPLVLVCLQDPFTIGTWLLHEDGTVPCEDGRDDHVWRLRAGFELLQPRMLEGQCAAQPATLAFKGFAVAGPANEAHWSSSVRLESGTIPPLKVVVRVTSAGKIEFSLAFGAKHPGGIKLPFKSETRPLAMDVAFAANGPNGLTVAAVAVLATLPWEQLIAGTDVAVKGLGFDTAWMKNLQKAGIVKGKKGKSTERVADGATIAHGSWGFAAMTRADYQAWCQSEGRMPSEYVA